MRIIITRNTFARGQALEASPTPVDAPDALAQDLLAVGKAQRAPADTPSAEALPESVVDAEAPRPKTSKRSK